MPGASRKRVALVAVLCGLALSASLTACRDSDDDAAPRAPQGVMGAPASNPVLDFSGTYVVTSIFRGDGDCLDANVNSADSDHGGAFLAPCDDSTTQKWRFKAISPQLYQLMSTEGENQVCLNGNDRDSPVHDGATFSEPCRTIADQAWTVEATPDGYIRLHSKRYADSVCLESNQASSEVHAGSTFMDDCQNVSGQYWYLKNA